MRRAENAQVAVVGAGPYGLATAAHLRHAGVDARVHGRPMEFWQRRMPRGMILRSSKRASHIADPQRRLRIDDWEAERGSPASDPLTLDEFTDYALWFQRRAVPDVDERMVRSVAREDGGFRLELEDGARLEAERVVVAAGLSPFARRPWDVAALEGSGHVSHSSQHVDFSAFAGRRVVVVGGGQSALESAALLREAGARPEVVVRRSAIVWLPSPAGAGSPRRRRLKARLLAPTDIGGLKAGWIAAVPDLFRRLPRHRQEDIALRCIRPAGAYWLPERLEDILLHLGHGVAALEPAPDGVTVRLDDGSTLEADHVLLGTGFEIDVARYPFLAPELVDSIERADGYPVLGPGLESSAPGLHFVGAPAALAFGPVMRFVVGSWYAAPAVARRADGRRQPPLRFSF